MIDNQLAGRILPKGLILARTTPKFDKLTIPAGLLKDHQTSTWAKITVEAGTLVYNELPNDEHTEKLKRELDAGDEQVISPSTLHYVEPSADALFTIEFFQIPEYLEIKKLGKDE